MREPVEQRRVAELWEIGRPFAYVALCRSPGSNELRYEVIEPTLTEDQRKHLELIKQILIETLDVTMTELGSRDKAEGFLREKVAEVVKSYRIPAGKSIDKLTYYLLRDFIGFGKIDAMVKDPLIEDIGCNGVKVPIYVWHRLYESLPTNVVYESDDELDSFIIKLAYRSGRMITMASPMLDAALPDGSRVQLTLGKQVTRQGSTFTIRKFKADPFTIVDMITLNTVSSEMAALLWYLIESRLSVFVCGGAASGKTTLLNCLSNFISPEAKIVTIEDTPELQLYHGNWVQSVTRSSAGPSSSGEITLFDLLKAAMRQRPEYVIVGEVRGAEAYTLFQAMSTGHLGMATLHAESVPAAIHRLESEPMNIPRSLIAGLNMITIQTRVEKEGRPARRTITATEIVGIEPRTNDIITNEVYRWDAREDEYRFTGRCRLLETLSGKTGLSIKEIWEAVEERKAILDGMVKEGRRSFGEVTETIRAFYAGSRQALKR